MALTLPLRFEQDIQGRNINLIPCVSIGSPDKIIGVSTTQLILDGEEYAPLLLNVPSVKESIDLEKSKKHKISSITININNFNYNGQRFTDAIGKKSLINELCEVFWVSPSVTKPGDFTGENDAFLLYRGKIRRYEHTDDVVKIILEDNSQSIFQKDLPLTNVDENYLSSENKPTKFANKPIPMVFGKVDKSPLVSNDNKRTLIADTKPVVFNYEEADSLFNLPKESVWIYTGENYVNLVRNLTNNSPQFEYPIDNIGTQISLNNLYQTLSPTDVIVEGDETIPDISKINAFVRDSSKNFTLTLSNPLQDINIDSENFDIPNGSLNKLNDGFYESNIVNWAGFRLDRPWFVFFDPSATDTTIDISFKNYIILSFDNKSGELILQFRAIFDILENQNTVKQNYEFLLLQLSINAKPNYELVEGHQQVTFSGLAIDKNDISTAFLPHRWAGSGHPQFPREYRILHTQSEGEDAIGLSGDFIDGLGQNYHLFQPISTHDDKEVLNKVFNFPTAFVNDEFGGDNDSASFQIATSADIDSSGLINLKLELDYGNNGSNVKEIDLVRESYVANILQYDFYADVSGREMEHTTSPHLPLIIKNILTNELGLKPEDVEIDTTYFSWKYDFTIEKKINSKRLLEHLTKTSPYIPRFDNLGKFKFNVVKSQYNESDVNAIIFETDVIDYSYTKTKIEDVITRLEFNYHWSYAEKEFTKKVRYLNRDYIDIYDIFPEYDESTGTGYNMDFYGLPNDHSESTLVIDDDRGKYIRDDLTAERFAKWLLAFHANQHLKMKLKLPLKYMYLEIGDIIKFDNIIGDVKPYNINYTSNTSLASDFVNGQPVYPYFMVISSNKNLEFCEFEVIQMHQILFCPEHGFDLCGRCLDPANPDIPFEGNFPEDWNGENAGSECDCNGNTWDVCGVCGGNAENVENCVTCPEGYSMGCDNVCREEGTETEFDCNNVCGGDAMEDECGVCGGDGELVICSDGSTVCNEEDCISQSNLLKDMQVLLNEDMVQLDNGDIADNLWFNNEFINNVVEDRIISSTSNGDGFLAKEELIKVNEPGVTHSFNIRGIDLKFHKLHDENGTLEVKYVALGYELYKENSDEVHNNAQHNFGQTENTNSLIFAEWYKDGTLGNQNLFFEQTSDHPTNETKLKYSNENTLFELLDSYNFNNNGEGEGIRAKLIIYYNYGYEHSNDLIAIAPIQKTKQLYFYPAECAKIGDLNGDDNLNVLDIVMLANCILNGDCREVSYCGDVNQDGSFNVLDVVTLANCVLNPNCD